MERTPQQLAFIAKNWRDLVRPGELETVKHSPHHARLRCEPLERGFGTTLGMMLRRTLQSAIPGTAITHVTIEAAPDDVDPILLALKGVVLASSHSGPFTVSLAAQGPYVITAADIELVDGVTCANPEHVICTLATGERLELQLVCSVGRGYAPASQHADRFSDMIAIDALFAPVRRVEFTVTPARIGHQTDFDRLTLDVWTNGFLDPVEAVANAASILRGQLDLFLNFEELPEPVPAPRNEQADKQNENLWRTVDELDLSVRATNCLRSLNLTYIGELVSMTESQLMKTRGFGRKSLNEICSVLAEMDLRLGMTLTDWAKTKP